MALKKKCDTSSYTLESVTHLHEILDIAFITNNNIQTTRKTKRQITYSSVVVHVHIFTY